MKHLPHPLRRRLIIAVLLACLAPALGVLLQACRTTPAERQEIRQEERVKQRTADRMDRRRDRHDD